MTRAFALLLALGLSAALASHAVAQGGRSEAPTGQMTWAVHFSLAPTFFDPGETTGIITPFLVLYALHDGLVKPMPGKPQAGSLAESWSVSPMVWSTSSSCDRASSSTTAIPSRPRT